MNIEDIEPRRQPAGADPELDKQDLSSLSVAELETRIDHCEREIARCRAMIEAKQGHRTQAESLFKK